MARTESPQAYARNQFRLRLKQANSILFSTLLLEGGVLQIANNKSELLDELVGPQLVLSDRSPELMPLEFAGSLVYSVSVLKAFTVELYLKALLHLERKNPPKIHDLLRLHDLLGFKDKQQLEEMRKTVVAAPSYANAVDVLHTDLRSTLSEHRYDFRDIRYQEIPGEATLAKASDGLINMKVAVYTCQLACINKPEASGLQRFIGEGLQSVIRGSGHSDGQIFA